MTQPVDSPSIELADEAPALLQLKRAVRASRLLSFLAAPALNARRLLRRRRIARFDRFFDPLLARSLAGSMVVEVPEFAGAFRIDLRSHLLRRILRDGEYEADLAHTVRMQTARTRDAIDVGANVGLFTVLLARLCAPPRRVLAVEPMPAALALLDENLQRNGCAGNVILHRGLASAEVGPVTMKTIAGMEEYSSRYAIVHPAAAGRRVEEFTAESTTVDLLVSQHGLDPGFIKIDTEGAEHGVLTGAQETLRRCRPVVLSELSDLLLGQSGHSSREVIRMLESLGYRVLDADAPGRRLATRFEGTILALPGK